MVVVIAISAQIQKYFVVRLLINLKILNLPIFQVPLIALQLVPVSTQNPLEWVSHHDKGFRIADPVRHNF